MSDNLYDFAEDFEPEDFDDVQRRFRTREERMKGRTPPSRLSSETTDNLGLAVFRFLFVVVPLALLLTGIAVVPATEAIFNVEIGYWTAFFLLMTIRWLSLQPSNNVFLWKINQRGSR